MPSRKIAAGARRRIARTRPPLVGEAIRSLLDSASDRRPPSELHDDSPRSHDADAMRWPSGLKRARVTKAPCPTRMRVLSLKVETMWRPSG
jgi:hypothetical protein